MYLDRFVCLILAMLVSTSVVAQEAAPEEPSETPAPEAPAVTIEAQMKSISAAVRYLNAADLSCETDVDCVATPIGAAVCGGPETYLVSSNKNPYLAAIATLDEEFRAIRAEQQKENHMGICALEEPPKIACVAKVCSEVATGGPVDIQSTVRQK